METITMSITREWTRRLSLRFYTINKTIIDTEIYFARQIFGGVPYEMKGKVGLDTSHTIMNRMAWLWMS